MRLTLAIIFSLCFLCIQAQITNDDCSGAIEIAFGEQLEIDFGERRVDRLIVSNCGYNSSNESIWYQFTGIGSYVEVNLCGSYPMDLDILDGNCDQLTCSDIVTYGNTHPNSCDNQLARTAVFYAMAGKTYYILCSTNLYSTSNITKLSVESTQLIDNNTCETAQPVTVGRDTIELTYNHLRASSSGFLDCTSTNPSSERDSWYVFEGTGEFVTLENDEYGLDVELYKGNCSQFKCISEVRVTDKRAYYTELGQTYYLRVISRYTSDQEIILQSVELVENDECEHAIPITFGDTIIADFKYTLGNDVACRVNGNYYDVWYRFEGNDSLLTVRALNSKTGFGILSGSCEEWECESFTFLSPSYSLIIERGKTYYLHVFRSGSATFATNKGEFYTTISAPVVNDTYDTALPINCTDTLYGSLIGAQKDIDINQRDMPSVWYKITGTGKFYQFTADYTDNWHSYRTYTGLYKKSGNHLINAGRFSNGYIYLEQDSCYYINVAGDRENSFKLMLNCKPNVPHDVCSEAKLVVPQDTIRGNIEYARINVTADCGTYSYGDFWYRLEGDDGLYTINLTPKTSDYKFSLYKGNCEALTCISVGAGATTYLSGRLLNEGETYYLRVYSRLSTWDATEDFEIVFNPLPRAANDVCTTATKLGCGSEIRDSLRHALINEPSCNGDVINPGIWYEFEGNDSYYVLDVEGRNSADETFFPSYHNFALYEGSCGELLCLDRYFYYYRGQLAFFAEAGKNYFLVYRNSSSYAIDINVNCQIYLDSDDFSNATIVECDRQYVGFTHDDTYKPIARCGSNYSKDIWFKTTGKGEYVYYSNNRIEGIYTLENGGLTCYGDGKEDRVFLEEGITYYFRYVFSNTAYTQLYDFSISCSPLLTNDNCNTALELNCGDSLSINTVFSQGDTFDPECSYFNEGRRVLWYKIKGDGSWRDLSIYGGRFQLYKGDCQELICLDDPRMFYTEPSTDYYVRIYGSSYQADFGSVTITMDCSEAPVNDLCQNAEIITCGDSIQTSFDFVGFCDESDRCEEDEKERKIWYQLKGTDNWIHLTAFSRQTFAGSLSLELYQNNCCEQRVIENLYGTEKDLFFYAQKDSTYLIAAKTTSKSYYTNFTLTANCVNIEDFDFNTCETAEELSPNQAYETNLGDAIRYYNQSYLENDFPVRWVQFEGSGGIDTLEVDISSSNLSRAGIYIYIDPSEDLDLLEVKNAYKDGNANYTFYNKRGRYEIATLEGLKYFIGVHMDGRWNTNRAASITWNPANIKDTCQLSYPDTLEADYHYIKRVPFNLEGSEGEFNVYVSNYHDKSITTTFSDIRSGGSFNIMPSTSSLYLVEYSGTACHGHALMNVKVNDTPQEEPCIEVPFECETLIQHTDEELLDSTYQALKIESNAIIAYEATVVYNAEEEVLLLPGFETEDESDFTADIVLCEEMRSQEEEDIEERSISVAEAKETTKLSVAPNPFTAQTMLNYSLAEASELQILLFNTQGKLVRSIFPSQRLEAGAYQTDLDGSNLSAGLYYLLLHTNKERIVRKLVVVK